MLRKWRLARFKSVLHETVLNFAPLTLFTGANSAGKSTIIQSLLLTSQTIQSSVVSRPVVLNGHMARLGSFQDIVSDGDNSKNIRIGFEITNEADEASFEHIPLWSRYRGNLLVTGISATSVDCDYEFSVKQETPEFALHQLQPILDKVHIQVKFSVNNEAGSEEIQLKRSTKSVEKRLKEYEIAQGTFHATEAEGLRFEVTKKPRRSNRRTYWRNRFESIGQPVGASLVHFVPRGLIIRFDQIELQIAEIFDFISQPRRTYPTASSFASGSLPAISDEVVAKLVSIFSPVIAEVIKSGDPRAGRIADAFEALRSGEGDLERVLRLYALMPNPQVAKIFAVVQEKKEEIVDLLREGRRPSYALGYEPINDALDSGADTINFFFTRFIRYLGPLRDEPKPMYPLAGSSDPGDVGFRGEYTAAVLDLHRQTPIMFVRSSDFINDVTHPSVVDATLMEAVLDWLQYMGVGVSVSTLDRGKLGHELKITTVKGDMEHDLTQVGVGVSQVLPILVLALLASPGSTLVFEQPELHLHPKVQTRLADFFVAMTILKKQCIVETHSEYLINRIRYRAAAAEGSDVAESVAMYYVEKAGRFSTYRSVPINALGTISEWPMGFFDESEVAIRDLLRKGLEKRRRLKKVEKSG